MKIVFWNCGGTGNLGDDLCHLGAFEYCRKRFPAFSFKNIFLLNEHTLEIVNAADLLVIGGGRLLESSSDFLHRLQRFHITTSYIFVGVGVGAYSDILPFVGKIPKPLEWGVRNRKSAEMLERCGMENIVVASDVSENVAIKFKPQDEEMIGAINLKNVDKDPEFVKAMAKALKSVSGRHALVSFNSMNRHRTFMDGEPTQISDCNDTELAMQIFDEVENKDLEVQAYRGGYDDPARFAASLGRFGYMVCERFHACVLARRMGIPFVAISSNEKVSRFMIDEGIGDRMVQPDPDRICEALTQLREEAMQHA